MDIINQFNDTLKELLTKNGYSVLKFSKEVGIHANMIYRWTNEKYLPTIPQIIKIADYFDCSTDYILGLTDVERYTKSTASCTFLERYDLLIEMNGYTDYQVAKKCEIGRSAISKWRKHGQRPSTTIYVKLVEVLGCSLDYLLCRSDRY